jgi:hypothetical protein
MPVFTAIATVDSSGDVIVSGSTNVRNAYKPDHRAMFRLVDKIDSSVNQS